MRGGLVDGAAVVVERGARRPASSAAGNNPPRQRQLTVSPAERIMAPAFSRPAACTMSRHGAIAVMPARTQPSTSCSRRPRLHGRRVDREQALVVGEIAHQAINSAHRHGGAHRGAARKLGIEQAGPAASARPEQLGEMQGRARALLAADHGEVVLHGRSDKP